MSAHHRRSCSADAVRTAREGGTDADGEAMTSGSPHPAPAGGPGKHATSGPMSIAPPTAVPASAPRQTPTANRTPVLRTAAPGPWPDPQHWPPARAAAKTQSQRCWRRLLHVLTRINVGLSPDELYESGLHLRIRRNVPHAYQIGIFGIKGGVGRTTVTVALGSALSRIRGDRILAIDADPDGGNLADRARRQSRATVADLLADKHLLRYNDIRTYASMNGDKLEVLPAAEYGAARRAFDDVDWTNATDIVSRYYNLILADSGAAAAGGTRCAIHSFRRGDRRQCVRRRRAAGRSDTGLVAAEWISASARLRLRGDQPFDPGQSQRRRGGSGGAVPAPRSAWTGTGAAVGQGRLGGH
ncbi:MAG: hypothetical protein QOE48_1445 [Mycobacterium sp.]|jgi:hypothetical protein|nr:hypothetical protein [Mycobacterium sp.]